MDTFSVCGVPKGTYHQPTEVGTFFGAVPPLQRVLDLKLVQVGRLEPSLLDFLQVGVPAV